VKIWWTVRKAKEKRISALEILAEHWVTREDLHACREDVRATDDKNLEIVFNEIKGLRKEVTTLVADNRKENTSEHNEIKGIIIDKLSGQ
ncbi:MAG: hypothetical protein KJO69_11365, partial [Gammaproteobacteria bacterium]|nr:hypothetical protein [Gammaproteobacteria bacterium]